MLAWRLGDESQQRVAPQLELLVAEKDRKRRDALSAPVRVAFDQFRRHLGEQRILDPACGSGNFLYVAMEVMKHLEWARTR